MNKKVLSLIATMLFCVTGLQAHAVIVDFDAVDDIDFDPGETYTEDGFVFDVQSGSTWGIIPFGNPASSLAVGIFDPVGIGDTISVTALSSGLFTFDAFDFAAFINAVSDGVDFIGLVNGGQTELLSNVFSSTTVFATGNPLFASAIDELLIVGASQGDILLLLDNFVLTEVAVAEPTTLFLLGIGLAGLGFSRRKTAARVA